jgi:hypothetical protein
MIITLLRNLNNSVPRATCRRCAFQALKKFDVLALVHDRSRHDNVTASKTISLAALRSVPKSEYALDLAQGLSRPLRPEARPS